MVPPHYANQTLLAAPVASLMSVAGGHTEREGVKSLRVLLKLWTQRPYSEWSTASSLPHLLKQGSATLCRDQVYVVAGFAKTL